MTSISGTSDSHELVESFGERWNRFWFTPADPGRCCVLRIIVGLLAALHLVDLGNSLSVWYSHDGVLPPATVQRLLELTTGDADYRLSYLNQIRSSGEIWAVHIAAIVAAVCFGLGLFTRLSGALTLVAVLSYVHRAPQIAGHLEPVLSSLLIYLCLAPAGARWSLDQLVLRSNKRLMAVLAGPGESSLVANRSLRLIQVHVAMFYAMMGLTKLYGDAWWDGNAIWLLLAQTESRPLDLTGLRSAGRLSEYLLNFWTHAIVYFELAFPILIWSRLARPILLATSVFVWLSLIISTGQLL